MMRTYAIASFLAAAALAAMPMSHAAIVSIDLSKEFSGGSDPSGAPPWLNATFADAGVDTVTLTLSSLLNGATEFVTEWDFNFDPLQNTKSTLTFSSPTVVAGAFTLPTLGTNVLNNQFKADGDGFFDFSYAFDQTGGPDPAVKRFGGTDQFRVTITGTGINAADFNYPSVLGGDPLKNGFLSAAHIQGIDAPVTSGWIGDSGGGNPQEQVPEPATLALFALALAGLAVTVSRRA